MENGAVVFTIDQEASSPPSETSKPIELLGTNGFDVLDPFIPIEVPHFSKHEANQFLDYLANRKFLRHPYAFTKEGRQEFFFVSQMNPHALYQSTLRY